MKLVVAGTGPALEHVRAMAKEDDRIVFLTDVDDNEKPLLMRGCAAYALPTKPEPDFVETFGIALAEKMLAGGGPIVTTLTGGTGEAVGDAAVIVEPGDIAGLADAAGPGGAGHARRERARPGAAGPRPGHVLRPGGGLRRAVPAGDGRRRGALTVTILRCRPTGRGIAPGSGDPGWSRSAR